MGRSCARARGQEVIPRRCNSGPPFKAQPESVMAFKLVHPISRPRWQENWTAGQPILPIPGTRSPCS